MAGAEAKADLLEPTILSLVLTQIEQPAEINLRLDEQETTISLPGVVEYSAWGDPSA